MVIHAIYDNGGPDRAGSVPFDLLRQVVPHVDQLELHELLRLHREELLLYRFPSVSREVTLTGAGSELARQTHPRLPAAMGAMFDKVMADSRAGVP